MNTYLRSIATYCVIAKPFSFHTARHTFATTITLSNGVPIETVSKMLGHTQLNFYVNVINNKLKGANDGNTIGLLCTEKNEVLVEYVLKGHRQPLGV